MIFNQQINISVKSKPNTARDLGPCHTSYDIQIIIIVLKSITVFFSKMTLDHWNIYYACFGVTRFFTHSLVQSTSLKND